MPATVPFWFSLATYGAAVYREAVTHSISLARAIAAEIERRDGFTLVREPRLSIVVFERDGWSMSDYDEWSAKLLEEQRAFVLPSSHKGRPNARFAIVNPLTTYEQLVGILETME